MSFLTEQDKLDYENAIYSGLEDFASKSLTWKRSKIKGMDRFGEDSNEPDKETITLPILCNYNYMRSWPITDYTTTGEVDRQSVQILIPIKVLKERNLINADGYLKYSPAFDKFYIDGIEYKTSGDTKASQAFHEDLLFTMILIRPLEETRNQ